MFIEISIFCFNINFVQKQISYFKFSYNPSNNLNLSLEIAGYGYNVTLEYFLPPFVTFAFESGPLGFIKSGFNKQKYVVSNDL